MGEPALPTSLDLAMTEPKLVAKPHEPAAAKPALNGAPAVETDAMRVRQRAEALLVALGRAKDESRKQLTTFNRADAMEAVVGRSAIDTAIEKTRQSLRAFDEALLSRNNAMPGQPGSAS